MEDIREAARRLVDLIAVLDEPPIARTGDVAAGPARGVRPSSAVAVQGGVSCSRALIAPISRKSCLYYRITTTAKGSRGDRIESNVVERKTKAAPFAIDDGSGPVWIDARAGADCDALQTKIETKRSAYGTTYEIEEAILPIVPRLYVSGRAAERGAIVPRRSGRVTLSTTMRDGRVGERAKAAKRAFAAGVVTGVLGFIIASGLHGRSPDASTPDRDENESVETRRSP